MQDDLCDVWAGLLTNRYTGQIIQLLLDHRKEYTDHLNSCPTCNEKIEPWLVWTAIRASELNDLTPQAYEVVIKKIKAFANGTYPQ